MYRVSAQGVDECMINVHYYYYYYWVPSTDVQVSPPSLAAPCFGETAVAEPEELFWKARLSTVGRGHRMDG